MTVLKTTSLQRNMKKLISMKSAKSMEEPNGDVEVTNKDFEDIVKPSKEKPTKAYDFILKAWEKYRTTMYLLCKRIIYTDEIPKVFYMTNLHMLWKMKVAANILANNRFLHIKSWLPRTCAALIVNKTKDTILEHSSKYQIGNQPGHSHREHVFAIISIILKKEKSRRGVIFTAADIIKYIDIFDVMA